MKRGILAAVTVALTVLLAAPPAAAAETAAPDPVRALRKQLKAERGVKLAEVSRLGSVRFRIKGGVQLSPSGPVAVHVSVEAPDEEDAGTIEILGFPRAAYLGGADVAKHLPGGKSWVGEEAAKGVTVNPVAFAGMQPINVFDPAVLKATLRGERARPVSGGHLYQGHVTYQELYEASKSFYAERFGDLNRGDRADRKISYRLRIDRKGLIERLQTREAVGSGEHKVVTTADTRFSDWGAPMVITAPAADEVLPYKDFQNLRVPVPDPLEGSRSGLR
ncbi:hypothetical protein [Nonomuraea sp. NPDC048826]|uniref:hypothetical protein n=1 Tax=Nonomuraea sp. NPDC048826 TaxID=3364347 RepID=UPI00371BA5D3